MCNNLKIYGIIANARSVVIVSSYTNMSNNDIKHRIMAKDSVQFGFIKRPGNRYQDIAFSDGDIYIADDANTGCTADWSFDSIYTQFSYGLLDAMPILRFEDHYLQTMLQRLVVEEKDEEKREIEEKYQETPQESDRDVFEDLFRFFDEEESNKQLLETELKSVSDNEEIDLFSKHYLKHMSLFEFFFFKCGCYHIAQYVKDTYGFDDDKIFEMIVGTDLFEKHEQWTVSIDRSTALLNTYPPSKCELNISYEYDDSYKISKTYLDGEALKLLIDTNLILQNIDQRGLQCNGLIIWISVNVKYRNTDNLSRKTKVEIGAEFNWKIEHNSSFSVNSLYVSSLWITNDSIISGSNDDDDDDDGNGAQFRIICEKNILIDQNCAISGTEFAGGEIMIYCDRLEIRDGGQITVNKKTSIGIITNTNIDNTNINKILCVKGVQDSGNKGVIRFGYFNQSENKHVFVNSFAPNSFGNINKNFDYHRDVIDNNTDVMFAVSV